MEVDDDLPDAVEPFERPGQVALEAGDRVGEVDAGVESGDFRRERGLVLPDYRVAAGVG